MEFIGCGATTPPLHEVVCTYTIGKGLKNMGLLFFIDIFMKKQTMASKFNEGIKYGVSQAFQTLQR